MKRIISIFTIICLLLLVISPFIFNKDGFMISSDRTLLTSKDVFSKYSSEELIQDYDQLWLYIQQYHPKEFTDEEALKSIYENNRKLIKDDLTEIEFLRIVTPLISTIDCGHTIINLPNDLNNKIKNMNGYFPLEVRLIENSLYVVDSNGIGKVEVGDEVLEINSRSIKEIINIMKMNISSDGSNETYKNNYINNNFNELYFKYVESAKNYKIELRDYRDEVLKVKINSVKYSDVKQDENNNPYESLFEEDYAILKFRSFHPNNNYVIDDYYDFIDEFFKELSNKKVKNLILDIRDNRGGDPRITNHLFSYFSKFEQEYFTEDSPDYYEGLKELVDFNQPHFTGELYTLVNGYSFSASGHLTALIKYQDIGTIIGEETGGSYKCMDSSWNFDLNNTKLVFRCATQTWSVKVEGIEEGIGILPNIEKVKSIEDYLGISDSVLELTVRIIKSKQGETGK